MAKFTVGQPLFSVSRLVGPSVHTHTLRAKLQALVYDILPKLQALVYDILPSTTAVFSYAIGPTKLSANEQFVVDAQTV